MRRRRRRSGPLASMQGAKRPGSPGMPVSPGSQLIPRQRRALKWR